MVSSRRLVLAASELRQAAAVQTHLQSALDLAAHAVRFDDVSQLLTPETDGDLLLLAFDLADAFAIETIVREVRVQKFPARLGLLEAAQVRDARLLDHLNPHLAGRWVWPGESKELTVWARRGLDTGTPFADTAAETLTQQLRRRLINHTPSLTALVDQLAIAAAHDVPVLIEGESGTGKSVLARLIHDCSGRRGRRFLVLSSSPLAGNHLASELFGHAKGAIPGGQAAKPGKLAAAGDGTLLIDEIETLNPEMQANLHRVLECGEYEQLGSNETQSSTARIIAATTWNLAGAVDRGHFRRDLYYRLNVVNLHLPPLRERPEDIGPLVRGMIARFGTKFGKRLFGISPEAIRALEAFSWPGNIRQLEHVVLQAVLTCTGPEVKLHHLSPLVHSSSESPPTLPVTGGFGGTLKQSRELSERANIIRALEKSGQSRTRAAQLLGVSRVTLYKKMKKYGLFTKPGNPLPFDRTLTRGANA